MSVLFPPLLLLLQEVAHAEIIRALKVEQAKELTKLRQEFELQARELGVKYEKKMKMLRDDLELRRKQEIHEIEEHKVWVEQQALAALLARCRRTTQPAFAALSYPASPCCANSSDGMPCSCPMCLQPEPVGCVLCALQTHKKGRQTESTSVFCICCHLTRRMLTSMS